MSKENFVKGAAILGLSGLIVKILGAIYRIPLTGLIGTEGVAYYTAAYNVYNLFLAISLTGFPTAIARLISEKRALNNYKGAYQVYSVSLWGMFIIGIISAVIVLVFAKPIVDFMGFSDAYYSMIALVPALLIMPVLSSYRGFFQGTQNMMPFALSQLVEQLLRVIVGFVLAYSLIKVGLDKAAAGATFGASIGSIGALLIVFLFFVLRKKLTQKEIQSSNNNELDTNKNVIKNLLKIAIPITIGASLAPLMGNLDTYFVSSRLASLNYTQAAIDDLYGQLNGMAHPMINFPQAFSTAIAISLIPVITDSFVKKDRIRLNQTADMGVKLSLIIALPCGIGMFMLAEPIMALLYPSMSAAQHASAGVLLQVLSIGVIFLILNQAYTAMLQAVNKQMIPVKNLFIGLIIKVVLSFLLIGMASININGAALSTCAAYLAASFLNLRDIRKYTKIKLSNLVKVSALPLLSTAIMAVVVWIVYKLAGIVISSGGLVTLLSIAIGGCAYLVALFATGAVTSEDLDLIPMGSKLKRFVRK